MSERERIVNWLRAQAARWEAEAKLPRVLESVAQFETWEHAVAASVGLKVAADAIESGDHLKRPEPTIPASEWVKTPSVGH